MHSKIATGHSIYVMFNVTLHDKEIGRTMLATVLCA